MTNEEAIKYLRSIRLSFKEDGFVYEIYEMSIEALQKQIPQKPIEVPIVGGDDMVCPACLVFVESGAKFCSECGQALLGEEEDEN